MARFSLAQRRFISALLLTAGVIVATLSLIGVLKARQEEISQRLAVLNHKPLQLINDFPPATKIYVRDNPDDEVIYIDVYYFSYGATLRPSYETSFHPDDSACGHTNPASGNENEEGQGKYEVNLTFERKTIPLKYNAKLSTDCTLAASSLKVDFIGVDVLDSYNYTPDQDEWDAGG